VLKNSKKIILVLGIERRDKNNNIKTHKTPKRAFIDIRRYS